MLGTKKRVRQSDWVAAWEAAKLEAQTPEGRAKAERLIEIGAERLPKDSRFYAWSGGKDAMALEAIVNAAGVERGVIGTSGVRYEYSPFVKFVREHKPENVVVRDFGVTPEFLNEFPNLVFPETYKDTYWWYIHENQKSYYSYAKEIGAENAVLGHRRIDGNVVRDGVMVKNGIRKVFPMHDFSHEDVFLLVAYQGKELPELYFFGDGFHEGTHTFLRRSGGAEKCLPDIYGYDPDVLRRNADIAIVGQYLDMIGDAV